ncbi:hypothetical protein AKJ52_02285 [candidate division MSBL1 archaeon SCGC-AAA382C18]|uniref:Nucleotidyl transferase AbiEii/AbiGii toxin family protein n=1 Tax=candidate division MSBL1 archaeon SCGC-AAA382C18 TaxID=1698281 RepID=A0A133VIU9_9EURY|nr:hypothetical protein AKJ52_02285 [candidate division MSBL1 archaeon SCGC-AAA382C18]
MLLPEELKRYGFQRKLKLIEQIWLDYLQDHLLALLYRNYHNFLFRGGTCIWKVYDGERFSEDLDLAREDIPSDLAEYLLEELELFGFSVVVDKERETSSMYHLRLGVNRPDTDSTTPLSLEILKDSVSEEKITRREIHSPYPDLPKIDVKTLTQDAILLEKISAVCDRNRPRDMHDIYRLLKNGASVKLEEVKRHRKNFTVEKFEESLDRKKGEWKGLKALMVGKLPEFKEEKQYIMQKFNKNQ